MLDSLSEKSVVIRPGRCDFNGLGSLRMEYEVLTSVHGTELFHILFAQLKVEYLKVCLHAFNVIGLRNNSDAALDHITKCDLTSGLAVFFGDLDNTRIAEHFVCNTLTEGCICLMRNIVFVHPLAQIKLLAKQVCLDLVNGRNDLIISNEIDKLAGGKV